MNKGAAIWVQKTDEGGATAATLVHFDGPSRKCPGQLVYNDGGPPKKMQPSTLLKRMVFPTQAKLASAPAAEAAAPAAEAAAPAADGAGGGNLKRRGSQAQRWALRKRFCSLVNDPSQDNTTVQWNPCAEGSSSGNVAKYEVRLVWGWVLVVTDVRVHPTFSPNISDFRS